MCVLCSALLLLIIQKFSGSENLCIINLILWAIKQPERTVCAIVFVRVLESYRERKRERKREKEREKERESYRTLFRDNLLFNQNLLFSQNSLFSNYPDQCGSFSGAGDPILPGGTAGKPWFSSGFPPGQCGSFSGRSFLRGQGFPPGFLQVSSRSVQLFLWPAIRSLLQVSSGFPLGQCGFLRVSVGLSLAGNPRPPPGFLRLRGSPSRCWSTSRARARRACCRALGQ